MEMAGCWGGVGGGAAGWVDVNISRHTQRSQGESNCKRTQYQKAFLTISPG